jgi:hypothetical protein
MRPPDFAGVGLVDQTRIYDEKWLLRNADKRNQLLIQ